MQSHMRKVVLAMLWMLGALSSFTAMALGGRELSGHLNTFEMLFFRSLIGLVVMTLIILRQPSGQRLLHVRMHQPVVHLLRNLSHFAGQYGWLYAIALIPLAQVFAIEFTIPIWVALLAPFVLGERMSWARATAILLGVVGVLVILRPGLEVVNAGSLAVLGASWRTIVVKSACCEAPRSWAALRWAAALGPARRACTSMRASLAPRIRAVRPCHLSGAAMARRRVSIPRACMARPTSSSTGTIKGTNTALK